MKKTEIKHLAMLFCVVIAAWTTACRNDDEPIVPPTEVKVAPSDTGAIKGFFLLNEANMGNNKASLDRFDYDSGIYYRNIYPLRNPGIVKELGDVGNDLRIYGSKLYAVINGSHLVEVMLARSARHFASISIPNCRYIAFDGGYAYVSSYAGPVLLDPNSRLGYVAKIDTATMLVVDTCTVGCQPEEMVVRNNRLYVANSGGYSVPNYDNTVSVIDLADFREIRKITVAANLHRMKLDAGGNIYVASRGDYRNAHSSLYVIDKNDMVVANLGLPTGNMSMCGDSLYVLSHEWNHETGKNTTSYAIVNTVSRMVVSRSFITDGTERNIEAPYGIAVNPETREIFVTDAGNYVMPGTLYCFSPDGKFKWKVVTGDIPAHLAFSRMAFEKF